MGEKGSDIVEKQSSAKECVKIRGDVIFSKQELLAKCYIILSIANKGALYTLKQFVTEQSLSPEQFRKLRGLENVNLPSIYLQLQQLPRRQKLVKGKSFSRNSCRFNQDIALLTSGTS